MAKQQNAIKLCFRQLKRELFMKLFIEFLVDGWLVGYRIIRFLRIWLNVKYIYIRRIKYDETCKMSVKSSKQLIRPNYFSSQFHTNIPRQQTQQTTHSVDLNSVTCNFETNESFCSFAIQSNYYNYYCYSFLVFFWIVSCYVVCFFWYFDFVNAFHSLYQFQFQFYRLHHFECRI